MRFSQLLAPAAVFASTVVAQIPAQFGAGAASNLAVRYGTTLVSPQGLILSKDATASQPTIGTAAALKGTYILLVIDPDAGTFAEVLHWLQPGLTSIANGSVNAAGFVPLTTNAQPISQYVGPAPPLNTGYHRYTLLLFSQPANFSVPSAFAGFKYPNITGFNTANFVKAAGLGPVVAANYFRVINGTANSTTTTSTAGATVSTPVSVAGNATVTVKPTTTTAAGTTAAATTVAAFKGDGAKLAVGSVLGLALGLSLLGVFA
ncbi:MAG: hypothetical protein M1829_002346 [Trizodia sp. TS-e1964]|nr:MAG: hypothetical protein M1829_002346 [Trizodia sp. TS-e1964]